MMVWLVISLARKNSKYKMENLITQRLQESIFFSSNQTHFRSKRLQASTTFFLNYSQNKFTALKYQYIHWNLLQLHTREFSFFGIFCFWPHDWDFSIFGMLSCYIGRFLYRGNLELVLLPLFFIRFCWSIHQSLHIIMRNLMKGRS